jgi:Zn-finger nucleic acid-binding protein
MVSVCPRCDVGLFVLHFRSVEVDYCERCHGIWLDAGEVERLMEATGAHPSDPLLRFHSHIVQNPRAGKNLCPRCDQRLHEIEIHDTDGEEYQNQAESKSATSSMRVAEARRLTLDRCPRGHGIWFDADELQELLALYPTDSGASRTVGYLNDLFGKKSNT